MAKYRIKLERNEDGSITYSYKCSYGFSRGKEVIRGTCVDLSNFASRGDGTGKILFNEAMKRMKELDLQGLELKVID